MSRVDDLEERIYELIKESNKIQDERDGLADDINNFKAEIEDKNNEIKELNNILDSIKIDAEAAGNSIDEILSEF